MTTRTPIGNDGRHHHFQVFDDDGNPIGVDHEVILTDEESNHHALAVKARAALDVNATYLALASPTNAQTVAQVRALTRECSGLIRLFLGVVDTLDGT